MDAGQQTRALFLPDEQWLQKAQEFAPDVVAFSTTTGMHLDFADIMRKIRQVVPKALVIGGGPHPTFSPEYVETHCIDGVCRGEGEFAPVELLNKLQAGEDYRETRSFWFKDRTTGEIHRNPQRPLVQELDELGFPDLEVIYDAGPIHRNAERKVFVTQRGCPMHRSICFHRAWRKKG